MSTRTQLILASGSPRRRELLQRLGLQIEVQAADIDERRLPGELAAVHVCRLAREKARVVVERPDVGARGLPVLAADTVVVLDDDVLGKPRDRVDALAMLRRLSGRAHTVLTAVAVAANGAMFEALSTTIVEFRNIDPAEAEVYCATGEPMDKAGAYGIQGVGGVFAARIDGSFTGVMGLPMAETELLLRRAGVDTWRERRL